MSHETERALYEGRAGRSRPLVAPGIPDDSLLHAKLWDNPCWFSFRLNYLALHFNNPVYGFIQRHLGLLRPEFVVLWSLHLGDCSTFSDVVRSSGFPKNTLSRAANKLAERGIAFTLVSRRSPGHYSVTCDDYAGGCMVAEHLVASGRTSFGLVTGDPRTSTSIDRCAGFLDTLAEHRTDPLIASQGATNTPEHESVVS